MLTTIDDKDNDNDNDNDNDDRRFFALFLRFVKQLLWKMYNR